MKSDCYVSVVIPLFDDDEIVDEVVVEIDDVLANSYSNYEIVLVDDGSTDQTVDRVIHLLDRFRPLRLIRLSRSFGQETAISAGLDSVIGDFVVVMLPDVDPPNCIPDMVERSRQGCDIVFGIARNRESEPLLYRLGVKWFYWYCNYVIGLKIPKNTTHFRVLSRRAVNAVTRIKDRMRYLRTLSVYVGYENYCFEYQPIQRRNKPRRKSIWQAAALAINVVVANSLHPLRIVSWLAAITCLIHMGYVAYLLFGSLTNSVPTSEVKTFLLQSSSTFAILFLIVAVLCQYIGRLLSESTDRPLYYVLTEHAASRPPSDEPRNVVESSMDE